MLVDKKTIALLDLNFTLVENSLDKKKQRGPYDSKIALETYRQWLVELLREQTVLLCTVRHERFQAQTLERVRILTGWQPNECYFNPTDDYRGYVVKKVYLEQHIFPKYGTPEVQPYVGIESAAQTRAMYKKFGIPAIAATAMQRTVYPPVPLTVSLLATDE